MGKRKPPDLQAHLMQAPKQKAPESPVVFDLPKQTFRLDHSPNRQRMTLLASKFLRAIHMNMTFLRMALAI
ncbi:hypothetical protein J14TS5_08160 [Paenibacillus lautus]|nr:hypothetical protein J14TS5_08160 [Paenibacillus lautus]